MGLRVCARWRTPSVVDKSDEDLSLRPNNRGVECPPFVGVDARVMAKPGGKGESDLDMFRRSIDLKVFGVAAPSFSSPSRFWRSAINRSHSASFLAMFRTACSAVSINFLNAPVKGGLADEG